ncbi:hypothetical protein L7F22_037315 [Adiantum nelumboides]|nr:hypothetical protein [Adiantum nelumboides]
MQEVVGLMKNLSVHMMGGGRGQGYGYGCGYGSNECFAGGRGRGMDGRGDMFQCYNCGEWGHKSPQCDKSKRMGGDMFPLPSQIPSRAEDYGIEIKGEVGPSGLTAEEKGKTKDCGHGTITLYNRSGDKKKFDMATKKSLDADFDEDDDDEEYSSSEEDDGEESSELDGSSDDSDVEVTLNALYTTVQEKKLLKLSQPSNFKGEGANVERNAEVWLEALDDYFEATRTHLQNQMMLAMFRLTGDAKIWWKTHCRDFNIIKTSQSWEEIKDTVTACYLPPAHKATKMNEFFSLRQLSSTLEEYYSKFVTLRRYVPKMTLKQQVARFCQGFIEPLINRLEALIPTNLKDALLRAKPLDVEIEKTQQGRRNT